MKISAVNGSPRKNGNDALLLKAALACAQEEGHKTELIQLSDIDYRGCRSCLACKLAKEPWLSEPDCAVKDGLTDILDRIRKSDIMLIASPIYYGSLSADTYAFLERFWFSASRYDAERPSKMKHPLPSGLIVTMNISHPEYYQPMLDNILRCQNALISPARLLTVGDTCQFDHYENYHCTIFDGRHKETRRITEQSEDYERARKFMKELLTLAAES